MVSKETQIIIVAIIALFFLLFGIVFYIKTKNNDKYVYDPLLVDSHTRIGKSVNDFLSDNDVDIEHSVNLRRYAIACQDCVNTHSVEPCAQCNAFKRGLKIEHDGIL